MQDPPPAVVGLHAEGLAGAGDVLFQGGASGHPSSASPAPARPLLEVGVPLRHPLAQIDLVELQDA